MASTPANVRFLLVAALAAALRLALPGAAAQTPALPVPDGTKEGSPGCNSTSHRLARFFFTTPLVLWPAARARCPWAQARYKQIVAAIGPIVRQSGFPPPVCVPVSALDGLNLGPDCPPPEDVGAWVTGRSLVSRCEAARTPDERVIG